MNILRRLREWGITPAPKWPEASVALDFPESHYPWTAQTRFQGRHLLAVGDTREDALAQLVKKAGKKPRARVPLEVVRLDEGTA